MIAPKQPHFEDMNRAKLKIKEKKGQAVLGPFIQQSYRATKTTLTKGSI